MTSCTPTPTFPPLEIPTHKRVNEPRLSKIPAGSSERALAERYLLDRSRARARSNHTARARPNNTSRQEEAGGMRGSRREGQ